MDGGGGYHESSQATYIYNLRTHTMCNEKWDVNRTPYSHSRYIIHKCSMLFKRGKCGQSTVVNFVFQVVNKLLDIGADPKGLTLTKGDTPNHAALR